MPEDKVRERFHRPWPLVAEAVTVADAALLYDNSKIKPAFRLVATFDHGALVGEVDWPQCTPPALRNQLP